MRGQEEFFGKTGKLTLYNVIIAKSDLLPMVQRINGEKRSDSHCNNNKQTVALI